MIARSIPLLFVLAGCGGSLSPSLSVADDPRLAALPAGSTLLAGGDLPLLATGALAPVLEAWAGTIPNWDLRGLQAFTLGCGEAGCVALVDGAPPASPWGALATRLDPTRQVILAAPGAGGLDVAVPGAGPLVVRQLSDEKLVLGDRDAVRHAWPGEAASLEPASLAGHIPAGAAWVLALDPPRLFADAATEADRHGRPDLVERIRRLGSTLEGDLDGVSAVAVALEPALPLPEIRLRVTCSRRTATLRVEGALEALLAAPPSDPARRWLGAARSAEVVRVDDQVELVAAWTPEALAGLLAPEGGAE